MKAKRIIVCALSGLVGIAVAYGLIHKLAEKIHEKQALYDSLIVDEVPDYSDATPNLH